MMNTKHIVASAVLSSALGVIVSEPIHGVALGTVVLAGLGASKAIQWYRSSPSSRGVRIDGVGHTAMEDITADSIREELEHPDITNVNVKQNESESLRVSVEYAGKERNLRRLVGSQFDIQATIPNDEGGIHAILYPNIDGFD